jgi:outer membrane protein assembly factor BamB
MFHRVLGRFPAAGAIGCLFVFFSGLSSGADWPQFRGPDGGGVSAETGLPTRWSATENIRWKADLPGRGLSNPVIARDRVFVTACSGFQESRLHVLCFSEKTGKRLWERQFWSTGITLCHPKTCMAAPTPVTDGDRVYALFATGDLVCLDREGDLLWYRALSRDYPTIGNNVGMASSPVLFKNVLLVPMDNAGESFAAGIDKLTGQNIWRSDRPSDINWVTPLVFNHSGRAEAIFQSARGLIAYDPETGSKQWSLDSAGFSTVASPVAGDGVLITTGGEVMGLRPGSADQAAKVAWKATKLHVAYTSPLYYQKRVYAINNTGVLNCADTATGKLLWQQRCSDKGTYWASPIAADGHIYVVNEAGTTTVLKAGDEPKVVATNTLADVILATPAVANGAIYLRSDQHLFCMGQPLKK